MITRGIQTFKCVRNIYSYATKLRIDSMKNSTLLNPPEHVKGLTELNRSLFDKEVEVPVLHFTQGKISDIIKPIKKYLLKIDKFKPVQSSDKGSLIYLNPYLCEPNNLPDDLVTLNIKNEDIKMEKLTLTYSNYSTDQILKAVLPSDKEGMASFTKIGHIIHVNLREHLIPYKKIIGKVLFDKTPNCKTVVNKTNNIDNTYRNFQMEVLEGENDMMVKLKENLCTFEFDFSTVYWNSRLSTEHERIVNKLNENDVLFDIFAGVGPFAVPAAKKSCIVHANDLNPESYKWLQHNFKINKIKDNFYKTFNKDGRDFISNEIKQYLPKYLGAHNVFITMNLPAMAVEFLNAFVGLLEEDEIPESFRPPTVFLYCFAKGEDYNKITRDLVLQHLGCDKIEELFRVRTVSSMKEMMRVTIRLDKDLLLGKIGNKRKNEDDHLATKKFHHGETQENQ